MNASPNLLRFCARVTSCKFSTMSTSCVDIPRNTCPDVFDGLELNCNYRCANELSVDTLSSSCLQTLAPARLSQDARADCPDSQLDFFTSASQFKASCQSHFLVGAPACPSQPGFCGRSTTKRAYEVILAPWVASTKSASQPTDAHASLAPLSHNIGTV